MRTPTRPPKSPPEPTRKWRLVHKETGQPAAGHDVKANTKSEDRALFKDGELLPATMRVIEVH